MAVLPVVVGNLAQLWAQVVLVAEGWLAFEAVLFHPAAVPRMDYVICPTYFPPTQDSAVRYFSNPPHHHANVILR